MNIVYLANSRFPSERAHMTQVVHMCNAFSSHNHRVTLIVTDRKTSVTEKPEEHYGVSFAFDLKRVHVPDMAGNTKIPPILRSWAYLLQRIFFAIKSIRYIHHATPDIVYGRDEWVLFFVSLFTNSHVIWESHEAKFSLIARALIARTKKVVVISEGIAEYYKQNGIHTSQICVAHDAIDERFFASHVSQRYARDLLGISPSKPAVFYIGGLDEWKGIGTFFEASRNQHIFEAYVIGGKEDELMNMRLKYPQTHFPGPRPYRDLHVNQQGADVLVIPNTAKNALSAKYTSPLKLFAHMTSGVPIVASRIPSIESVVSENEVWFATADDAQSLYTAIESALEEQVASKLKSSNAYKKVMQCTWSNRAEKILAFLK